MLGVFNPHHTFTDQTSDQVSYFNEHIFRHHVKNQYQWEKHNTERLFHHDRKTAPLRNAFR